MTVTSTGISHWVKLTIISLTLGGSYFLLKSIETRTEGWALGVFLLFACCAFMLMTGHIRRSQQGVLALMMLLVTSMALLIHQHLAMLYLVVCLLAIELLSKRRSVTWVSFCVLAVFVCEMTDGKTETNFQDAFVNSFITLFLSGFAFLRLEAETGRRQTRELLHELETKNVRLANYAAEHEYQLRLKERQRLSRELHDTLGHKLTTSIVQLEAAEKLIEKHPSRVSEMIRTSRNLLREGLNQTRDIVRLLDQDEPQVESLSQALAILVESFQSTTNLSVLLRLTFNEDAIPINAKLHIFRIVQEALTNVSRHAQATDVRITLTAEKAIDLVIEDNGKNLDNCSDEPLPTVKSIESRVSELRGNLKFFREDSVTRLHVGIPLAPYGGDSGD